MRLSVRAALTPLRRSTLHTARKSPARKRLPFPRPGSVAPPSPNRTRFAGLRFGLPEYFYLRS